MMYKIAKDRLPELYAAVAAVKDIYVPVENANQCLFEKWTPTSNVNIDCLKTVKSAKEVFFPQSENLISFKVTGKNIDIIEDRDPAAPFVIFGVRACDAKSFEILDNVFLSEPVDSFYKSRRENGVIVTMACNEPEETCFCGAFGINAANPQGGDVTTWLAGDTLYWKAETAKGEELTKSIANLLESAGDSDEKKVEETQASIKAILDKLPLKDLDLSYFSGENLTTKLNDVFYAEQWDELYKACLACGTCTFVCPTCQCYDIRDFDTGHGVKRFRCWDSCMFSDFTKCAHGNPRTSQKERFRQRFMHKLVYYPANNGGLYSCVGCGRCLAKCPVSLNIVKVRKAFGGESK